MSVTPQVESVQQEVVQVCILSFRRPHLLRSALRSIYAQTVDGFTLHVLVVDNDATESARAAFDAVEVPAHIHARYLCEVTPGIARARNRALDESLHADLLAFLDDDEIADPDWLMKLRAGMKRFNAAIVAGPVLPLEDGAPRWFRAGRFAHAPRSATGTMRSHVASNNVMMRRNVYADLRFDERLNFTGGEDTHFFLRARAAGATIVWVDDALVYEAVPANRASIHGLLRRAFSDGNRFTRLRLLMQDTLGARASRFAHALGGMLAGVLMLPLWLLGRRYGVVSLQYIVRACGTMAALFGRQMRYYSQS